MAPNGMDYGTGGGGVPVDAGSPYSADGSLTPTDLVQRLPSIVTPVATDVSAPPCDSVTSWVSENPIMAGLGLLAIWFAIRGKK